MGDPGGHTIFWGGWLIFAFVYILVVGSLTLDFLCKTDLGRIKAVRVLYALFHRVIDGERNPEALCEPLDMLDSMIIEAILAAIDAGVQALADTSTQLPSG